MRNLFLVLFTVGCFLTGTSQENTSFYFSAAQPSGSSSLKEIPDEFHGTFVSKKDSLRSLRIVSDSIYVRIISMVVVTRDEINATPGLDLRDSLLYGIYKDRPVEVVNVNDTIIFGIESTHTIFRLGKEMQARKCGDDLLLSTKENNGYWSVVCVSKANTGKKELVFAYLDHELGWDLMKTQKGLKKKKVDNMDTWLLDLPLKEMQIFISKGGFNLPEIYFPE